MQAENLANLLDLLPETGVCVIGEERRELLYCNERCRRESGGRARPGVKCREVWPELCGCCPLEALGGERSVSFVRRDPCTGAEMDVTAARILWDGGIPAVAVISAPRGGGPGEAQALRRTREAYVSSLAAVFGECVIVNLTADYYALCRRDALRSDLLKRGRFGEENRVYAGQTVHPDDRERFLRGFSREAMLERFGAGETQLTDRLRSRAADGSWRMTEFTAARVDMPGDEVWCVLVLRDVQAAYLQEQRRSLEMCQLATAVGTAYHMLISVNLTRNTYHMVEYARTLVEKPGDEGVFDDLIAAEVSTVRPDCQAEFLEKFTRQNLLSAYAGGARIVSMEVPHLGADGAYHWHFTQVVRVENPSSSDVTEITLSRNIDEEHRAREEALEKERRAKALVEEALEKAEQASQAKSRFLSSMSHDLRTPLNAIVGLTELARLRPGDGERQRDCLEKIAVSSAHLLTLVNEVLDVGKIESGAVELAENEFDLCALAAAAAELVRLPMERKGQHFRLESAAVRHPRVRGDARRLEQVLVNILENCSKYTGEGGRISLTLEEAGEEQGTGTYRLTVEDDGAGMKPEFLDHIFEPFTRADDQRTGKVPGTGLGMTIVKNLLTLMGGDIRVESEYGRGSKFIITLCMARCRAMPEAPAEAGQPEDFSSLRVLLVEDNELNQQIAAEMLDLLGARVEVAGNGREAVEAVASHPPLYYDLVFMDLRMPVMDGCEAARAIRSSGLERIGELPIIALTADAFPEDVRRARLAGMNGHLAKPISMDRLRGTLSACLAWRRSGPPGEP